MIMGGGGRIRTRRADGERVKAREAEAFAIFYERFTVLYVSPPSILLPLLPPLLPLLPLLTRG